MAIQVSLRMHAEAGRANFPGLDPAHLPVGHPKAAGDFVIGFLADEFQPSHFVNLRSRRCLLYTSDAADDM
jgi:hypothetical protein